MIGNKADHSPILRVLATYAVACFVVLQLLDIVLEPLGVSVSLIRWVMLIMIAIAPVLVAVIAWSYARKGSTPAEIESDNSAATIFQIGEAELDVARRQIRFGGSAADVQPKVFDLIAYLVRERERVVSKDELFDELWPSVVVSESSLTQSIQRARKLFRENGFEKDVIRTVPRKGYQLDCPVRIRAQAAREDGSAWADMAIPVTVVGLIATVLGALVWNSGADVLDHTAPSSARNSLVVLPFENMTADPAFQYFSDGLTETLTNSLTTVRDLRIIARGSAFTFRDDRENYANIGSALNVAHIVEGSVQRNVDDLRVSARLIRASDGHQLWSEIYNRRFDDIFLIQDDISRSIVEEMSGLLSARLAYAQAESGTVDESTNAEAYRLLLLGREQVKHTSAQSLLNAENNFRAALALQPAYPQALLGLARALRLRAVIGELPREATFTEALALLRRSLELQPDYADAYVELGEIEHRHFWDFAAAADSYEKALEINPGSAGVHAAVSRFLSKIGDFDRSIDEAAVALDLDPKSSRAATSLAIRQIRARALDDARATIDSLASQYPDHVDIPWLEGNWHIRNRTFREALQWISQEELDYLRLCLSAIALHHLGREDQAQTTLDELIATDSDGAAFQIAEVFAQWDDADSAFEWLQHALSQGDPGLAELYSSVNLESLYSDDRFAVLAEQIGLPEWSTAQ